MKIERKQSTIVVWNVCECGAVLHSMSEGERGTCSSCWVRSLSPQKHEAMRRLIASAFNGSTQAEKDVAVDAALRAMDSDRKGS